MNGSQNTQNARCVDLKSDDTLYIHLSNDLQKPRSIQ